MATEITFPNIERLNKYQKEILFEDNHRFKVCIWHRRCRKTTTAIIEITKQAHIRKGIYWHLFPTYTEAKNSIWRDPKMLFGNIPEELIEKRNEAEMVVTFKNGSIYQLIGADNADRLRGAGPMGMVLDEYDTMKNDVWPVVEPILRANGGWAWFVGTPKGKQKLYDLYNRGQDVNNTEWKSWILRADQSGIIPSDQLEESRKTMSQSLFNQEWMCDFLEGEGSVFRNVRAICNAVPQKPKIDHYYVMGVDLAKVQDYTVIAIYDRTTNQEVYQDRFQTLEWPFQKKRIMEIGRYYNNALMSVDATGIGDPIVDDLLRAGCAVEPFKITNQSKKELIEKLSIWIEQAKIRLLPMEETMLEFDNFSYDISSNGRIVYNAREGYHDDIVIANALAVWQLQPLYIAPKKEELPLVKEAYIQRVKMQHGEIDPYFDLQEI